LRLSIFVPRIAALIGVAVMCMPHTEANALTKRQQQCLAAYNACIKDIMCQSKNREFRQMCVARCGNRQVKCNKGQRADRDGPPAIALDRVG
jgi:hypothetical protein